MPKATSRQRATDLTDASGATSEPNDELAAQVLRQFRLIFNAVRSHFREVEKSAGLGGAQVWALSLIGNKPGIGVGELASSMDVHQSTASNLVRGLLTRDMIRSQQSSEDRRAVGLWIRPGGRAVLRRVPRPFTGVLPKALASLDASTLQRLQADLAMVIGELGPDEKGAQTPLAQM